MKSEKSVWNNNMPAVQFRVARPTNKLREIIQFYNEGLGLQIVGSFQGHSGYDGVMFGLPGVDYHLEFTQHEEGGECRAPSRDNLLVFYIPDRSARDSIVARLKNMGYAAVEPENPYWEANGVTIEDPDGWRIVLMNTAGLQ
jgi:catechol 2,3-dioxygenase-like lactoylglutathione lyase family enzyme